MSDIVKVRDFNHQGLAILSRPTDRQSLLPNKCLDARARKRVPPSALYTPLFNSYLLTLFIFVFYLLFLFKCIVVYLIVYYLSADYLFYLCFYWLYLFGFFCGGT